ncbi:hypothetical protein [Dactylosporangium sp. CS-033363]|uniref:hypothetical protein n=1 Tax=Dactylosporangium sp. CS-033363 TaxID=3239935 RepID=UPI003D8F0C93
MTDVWDRLGELSDDELTTLVAAAGHVIADLADDAAAAEVPLMPVGHLGAELAGELRAADVDTEPDEVTALLRDRDRARALAVAALRPLAAEPELAAEVAAAYEARRGMMAVDGGLLLGGALLVLALKVKRIKVGKVDVSFYEARAGALAQLRAFLGK